DVFLPDRRTGLAPGRSGVSAAHGGRQATHAGEVRVGHPRDAEGHDLDRRGSGRARRTSVLGGGSRWRDFLGDGDDRLVDHPWRRQCTRLGAAPPALILIATGEVWRGIGLAVFCALVV